MPKVNKVYVWRQTAKLPSEYKEVEYIQSSWTQCINTWFNVTKNSKIFVDIQFTSTTVQQRAFGVDNWIDGVSMASYINGSGKYSRYIGNWWSSFTFQATTITADTSRHTFTLDNSRYIITTGWNEVSNTVNSQTITNNPTNNQLAILAQYWPNEDAYYNYASAKLYACKIWDNNVLVRDFIPCYRKSDNVIGLYDLVNNQFYTNAWTGNFTKWDDVQTYKEFLVRQSRKTTEYVLLSEWWSVNKFSELSLNGVRCVSNNTSNWLGNVTSTDKFWIHYKVFDKPIVWFEIKMAASYASWDYREIRAYLTPSASNINTNNQRYITAWIQIRLRSQVYQWNSTWDVLIWTVGGTGSISQNKSVAAATGIMKWTMNSSGIWDLSIELSNWQSWTWQVDTSAIWDLYMIWFQGRRWYTWNTWTFYSVKVDLLDS